MELGQVFFGHLVTLAKVMEISYARAVYDVARCAVAQLDYLQHRRLLPQCHAARQATIVPRQKAAGSARSPLRPARLNQKAAGSVRSPLRPARLNQKAAGSARSPLRPARLNQKAAGSVRSTLRPARLESEGGGVGSVNAQTRKAEALAQMPCVPN